MNNDICQNFENTELVKELEPGGQKDVFVVNSQKYGECILKLIPISKSDRVLREIEIITTHKISNVPKIFESGYKTINGKENLYIFEEYIEGTNLTKKLQQGKLSLAETYKLLETLLSIEKELEVANIVHRDIKPDNILIDNSGNYYLIDFGIARALDMKSLTMTKALVGPHTPGYGAPELFQYNKGEIGIKSDLFSIGVVAYECIIGKHPFMIKEDDDIGERWYKTRTVMPDDINV